MDQSYGQKEPLKSKTASLTASLPGVPSLDGHIRRRLHLDVFHESPEI